MKNGGILKYLIFFLLIVFLVIIMVLLNFFDNKEKKKTSGDIVEKSIVESINNDSNYIGESGMATYKREHLNNFELNIKGIPAQVLSYIRNEEELYVNLKEYIYLNGLIEADLAEYEKSEIQKSTNRIAIIFKLNDSESTRLLTIIDLNDNSYKISRY